MAADVNGKRVVFPGLHHNPHDPVKKALPIAWQQLFTRWSRLTDELQAPIEAAIGAAINMLIVCLRNSRPTRREAEARFDEIAAKTKMLLMDHYDPVTGKRRNIFPFTQVIAPPLHSDRDKT